MESLRWEDYGIFGLIIGAMFVLLVWLIKSHEEERRDMRAMHREERQAWEARSEARMNKFDEAMQRREDKLEGVIRELSHAVRNLHQDHLWTRNLNEPT